MRKTLRLAAAGAAFLVGIAAIMMIMWPAWPAPAPVTLPWQADGWRLYLASPEGQAYDAPGRSYLLMAVTFLLALTVISTALGIIGGLEEPSADIPPRPAETDTRLNTEVGRLLQQLRTHLESNGLFAAALARANDQLPNLHKPEQVRMIISYLVLENDNMRKKTANLQASLESSRRQIDALRSNLAVAKVENLSDQLTGIKNRRGFDLTLASEITDARGSQKPMSLVLADLDNFKLVNDRYGHPVGDEVLKWFATLLGNNVKGRDSVARYGGEEFALVLPQTTVEAAAELARQIKVQVESRDFTLLGASKVAFRVTASFGVAQWRESESSDMLLKRADAKLYEAKAGGRNRVAA